jgi:trehalose 6-phosphate synthase/phosphatase
LEAFDAFLEKYPEYKKKVTLIMVAVPSRTTVEKYKRLKQHVDELVGRINGKHGTIDWIPVLYLYRFLDFEHLATLYNLADVSLITPLRDGMNLIAKEYIATKKDNRGVLILSSMAGAVHELSESIIVNPNDKIEVADAIEEALTMSYNEQIQKNLTMKNRLQRYTVTAWGDDFMDRLSFVQEIQVKIGTKRFNKAVEKELVKKYSNAKNRLIFLDYDGTLVPFFDRPEKARPDDVVKNILKYLKQNQKNEVILVSGRDKNTLSDWFGELNIGLSAEHGVWIKERNGQWKIIEKLQNEWKNEIRPILETYVHRTPGSFIEEKTFSLVWHYRNSHHELGKVRERELKEDLLHLTSNLNLQVSEGSKVIEVKNALINKGRAALHWLPMKEWDFIMAIGDDWTDEDIFEVMPNYAYTIKVGIQSSKASYFLTNHLEVRELLSLLGEGN